MGLGLNGTRFLMGESKRGLLMGRTLTLGHQRVCMTDRQYAGFLQMLGVSQKETAFADDFFTGLGASPLEVMDASEYEGAGLIHDLNEPVDPNLKSTFDTVIDIGTLEHVFNFPTAIRNCMELVKPGGNLVLVTPCHNLAGHGLYQFSPELFYSVLSPDNGYQIDRMLAVADGYWYSIRNPAEIKARIEIQTNCVIELCIRAKRIGVKDIFSSWPQQSDYMEAWASGSYGKPAVSAAVSGRKDLMRRIPAFRNLQDRWRYYKSRRILAPSHNVGMVKICKSDMIPY